MNIIKVETERQYPNLFDHGVVALIHIEGPRGAWYSFNRNAAGNTWFSISITNSRPSKAVIAAAEAA